jgi:hypothetical protein
MGGERGSDTVWFGKALGWGKKLVISDRKSQYLVKAPIRSSQGVKGCVELRATCLLEILFAVK